MLPQGMFSVAVATVDLPDALALRRPPRLRRPALDDGQRDADDPARPRPGRRGDPRPLRADGRARLPARRLLRRRHRPVAEALFWFAFSLPFNGLFLILTRTFFSLQRPWVPTCDRRLINLVLTAGVSRRALRALRRRRHRRRDRDRDARQRGRADGRPARPARRDRDPRLLDGAVRITLASAVLAGVAYLVWDVPRRRARRRHARPDRLAAAARCAPAASSTSARSWRCGCPRRRQLLDVVRRR